MPKVGIHRTWIEGTEFFFCSTDPTTLVFQDVTSSARVHLFWG